MKDLQFLSVFEFVKSACSRTVNPLAERGVASCRVEDPMKERQMRSGCFKIQRRDCHPVSYLDTICTPESIGLRGLQNVTTG